jgi:hypothetical protein
MKTLSEQIREVATGEITSLVNRLKAAVAHMPSHQREREQGKLLIESLQALTKLTETKP